MGFAAGLGPEGKGTGRGGMPDLLKRIGAPLVVAFLLLLTIISMVVDRRPGEGDGALPWWQAVVLEVTAPIERIVSAPIDGVRALFTDYVDLLGVRSDNRRLRRRIAEIESENLQFREALVSSGHLSRVASMRDEVEIPMLPVTHGVPYTRLNILLYSILLLLVTIMPYLIGMSGLIYLVVALGLGGYFLYYAIRMYRDHEDEELPMQMFRYSISYLGYLFLALLIDHYFIFQLSL